MPNRAVTKKKGKPQPTKASSAVTAKFPRATKPVAAAKTASGKQASHSKEDLEELREMKGQLVSLHATRERAIKSARSMRI
jgi:hypothetical protein